MKKLTLLETVQKFAQRRGLPQVVSVMSSSDDTIRQILGLLEEGVTELLADLQTTFLRSFYSFTHANGSNYKAFDFYSLPDFAYMVPESLWDTTGGIQVAGPLSDEEWNALVVEQVAPAQFSFRMVSRALSIYPYQAGITFRFEYISNHPIEQTRTSQRPPTQEFFENDSDLIRFPSQIVLADLRWRWEKEKGLPYAESLRAREMLVADFRSRETAPGKLQMDLATDSYSAGPGLLVPSGSWKVT